MGQTVTDVGHSKKELKKHAAAIHCSNTLSLLQRKITNALLYHAYKELMLKDEHEITIKQLCCLIGYQGNNHAAIKEAFKGLISTVIEWNLINDETGSENWTASSIIASVSLEGPLCYYAYSPRMKQLLHSPSMFGKIDLVIQSKFRSSYGLALYENCIRYRGLPHTKWFEMGLFKKLMGVPPGKYDVFRDFKRRVLDKAVEEVNTYSDLVVESECVREGRKVVKVRFKLKERAKKNRLGGGKTRVQLKNDDTGDKLRTKLLGTFCLSEEQVEQLLVEYDSHFIQDKVALIEDSRPFKEGRVQNIAGYLLTAIKNNYQPLKAKSSHTIEMRNAKQEIVLAELKRQIEEIRLDYSAYREETIHQAIQLLPYEEKNKFMEQFYHFADPVINTILRLQRNKYTRENVLESPQLKALLRQFAARELDLLGIFSLEEFVAQLEEKKIVAWQKLKSYDPDHPLLRFSE
ncbi:MAG: replication initiation protein [Gammaproteobacteria bacterium]|nr:replication initiation protein [Gammaproteobacteria bacterium]